MEGRVHFQLQEKIDKPDDLQVCDNWRGISLLSIAGKAFTKIMNKRLTKFAESTGVFPDSQNGGRGGRSAINSLHCLRLCCETRFEKGIPLYLTFFDLKKAYDRVPRQALWEVLEKLGVPNKFMRVLKELHCGMKASVDVEGNLTDEFEVKMEFGKDVAWLRCSLEYTRACGALNG